MSRHAAPAPAPAPSRVGQRGIYLTIRVTGVILAVLALGHYGLTHIVNDVAETDSAFIAERWSSALWIGWDGLLLGAALLHAMAGMATVIRDHRPDAQSARRWIVLGAGGTVVLFILGVASLTFSVIGTN
jgi:succinate dehydrogenase hydrophobic anchor subunit